MIQLLKRSVMRPYALALTALNAVLWSSVALAQTGGSGGATVDINTTSSTTSTVWYGQWWVWAVGVAVFLIIIVALTNRGGASRA
jgi:putative copper export protein